MGVELAIVVAVATVGLSTVIWSCAGVIRILAARPTTTTLLAPSMYFRHDEVAVLIAAHDEELVVAEAVRAAATQVPVGHVFVVSDGSTDDTVAIARGAGATVLDLQPNRGKAGAIRAGLAAFAIAERFPVVMLLDSDSRPRPDYLDSGLALFNDPEVVAVAGRATTSVREEVPSRMGRFLTAYRERLYLCTQYLHKFGQAQRTADAVSIVPGFASMYRTDILDRVDIDAPGLSIEDFNMTFEVHAKHLGRIAFHPDCAVAETQDPVTLGDYARQVRRWSLGFWQTVRRHRPQADAFWATLGLFVVETVVSSIVLLLVLPVLVVATVATLLGVVDDGALGSASRAVSGALPPGLLLLGFVLADVVLTLAAALLSRSRPSPLALLFPLMRVLDAYLCLRAFVIAFGGPSDGRWRSPVRRAAVRPPSASLVEDRHEMGA